MAVPKLYYEPKLNAVAVLYESLRFDQIQQLDRNNRNEKEKVLSDSKIGIDIKLIVTTL